MVRRRSERALAILLAMAAMLISCSLPVTRAAPPAPIASVAAAPEAAEVVAPEAAPPRHAGPVTRVTPTPTPTPVPAQPFALDLYRDGDFVPQYTFDWCVAASIQMAHNLVSTAVRSDRGDQGRLWEMARQRSSNSFNGANPLGWAQVLNGTGLGPYEVVSIPDYEEALRTAASAIAETGRPVGLVMWRGRHAWVMSGFESLGRPDADAEFGVTGIRVLDPLYPHGSGIWGSSPAPNSLLSPAELATQFVVREPRRWSSSFPTGYLLVLPISEA